MTLPQWPDQLGHDELPPSEAPPGHTAGRHRGAGWRPGQLGIAAIAAGVLAVFGAGAIILPSLLADDSAAPPAIATPAVEDSSDGQMSEVPGESPSASPSVQRSTAKPTTAPGNAGFEDQVLSMVNVERRKAHCQPVRMDNRLRSAARSHSVDMAVNDFFGHTGSDGSSFGDRARRAGYTAAMSENIAIGQTSPREVMRSWMRSEGHSENILNCDAKALGVGVAYRGRTPLWTQVFGRA